MFKALLIASLAAVALAQYGYAPAPAYGHHDDYAQPIPYQYGYDIAGDHGEFKQTRQEHGDGHGNVQGSYSYVDAHGIQRTVDYVADGHGFRASVRTNEPGTDNQSPADVELHASPVPNPEPAYSAPRYAAAPAPHYGGYGHYSYNMMFKALLIASLAAVALAQYGYGHAPAYGHHDDYAQPIPYQYGYDIAGDHGEFKQTRQEHGDGHGNVQGSYSYVDAHGIQRPVDYVADGHGFRASVKTNEPGTDNQSPADVELHAQPAQVHQPAYSAPRYGHYKVKAGPVKGAGDPPRATENNTHLNFNMMFKALLIASLAAVALAQYGYGHGHGYAPEPHHQPIPYQYGYDIAGDHGEFKQTRQEHGDGHGNVQGSYSYVDAHGIQRQVDYVADGHGFRASVKTNEPGTESQNPADVELHANPAHHQPSYSAPRHGYGHY
ncbi:uncharacterized protein [Parasteatoda tepidariorum]|uniref:uncharacterized protein n=1 Tax=Parasteatoda tepidariorum TaxID=114398 RepID=UPI0039BCFB59